MILTNRRHRLLYTSMAGMIVASTLPWLIIILQRLSQMYQRTIPSLLENRPIELFILLWSIMLLYMFTADLINQPQVESPLREFLIIAFPVATSILAIRFLIYSPAPLGSTYWIGELYRSIMQFTQGLSIEMAVLLLNLYLWFRTALLTNNDLTFLHVGMSFRVALLFSLVGNTLLSILIGESNWLAIQLFLLLLGFGLVSVALARIDQMAVGVSNSSGSLLPWSRLGQITLITLIYVQIILAANAIFPPSVLRSILQIFSPLWVALRWILVQLIYLIFLILTPALENLAQWLEGLMQEMEQPPVITDPGAATEYVTISDMIREVALVRYCLVTGIVVAVAGLLLLFFVRTARRQRVEETEEVQDEKITFGAGLAARGLDRLRAWLQLLRTYGASRQLLDAISVENMYANLLRIARYRGFPRPVAIPPDVFLPELQSAFPGHENELRDITAAYMRVYYGERPIERSELRRFQGIYRSIIEPALQAQSDDGHDNV